MRIALVVIVWLTAIATPNALVAQKKNKSPDRPDYDPMDYVGRYALNDDLLLDVRKDGQLLTLLPSFWRTAQILDSIGEDLFVSLLHRKIRFAFRRNDEGQIVELEVTGHKEIGGKARRLAPSALMPVELLLAGEHRQAVQGLVESGGLDTPERVTNLAFKLIRNYPSRARFGALFLDELAPRFPDDLDLHLAAGLAWMQAGDRASALPAFRRAAEIDPDDSLARRAVRHLDPGGATPPPDSAWQLPFALQELFRPPRPEEIARVREDWNRRDLAPAGVQHVATHEITLASTRYEVRIVSHLVHGRRHYGAIMVPEEKASACCSVVMDLHGIDDRYSGIDLAKLRVPRILREAGAGTIVVVPSYRGESLRIGDVIYSSEGDPRNGWDGATDDAIALLSVVLVGTPEVNPDQICAYGKSRGATVALLMGIRDERVDCVVAWAGPAEWFGNMGTFGWNLQEQVEWALWERWPPGKGWGSASQFVDWFLRDAIKHGQPGLTATRHRILASSPLYFVETVPAADLHYGIDDRSVPVSNAEALREAVATRTLGVTSVQVTTHSVTGHDMPYPATYDISRAFLRRHLRRD